MHDALKAAINDLPVHVRTAFYVAGKKNGVLNRKTWNGCAFNAVTGESDSASNASALRIDRSQVNRFIRCWDESKFKTDELATEWLLEYLPTTGLDAELKVHLPEKSYIKKITTEKVFKNEELAAFNEQVADMIDNFSTIDAMKSKDQLAVEEVERTFALV